MSRAGFEVERYQERLTVDGDGDWDYSCPKCYEPFHPAIVGRGRPCPLRAPKLTFQSDGLREWFSVTCGSCGFYDHNPQPEPVYKNRA
jgi:hypothetical protein